MLTSAAMRAGFSGGLVVDFPHSTRAKKYFLVLMVGSATPLPPAEGMDGAEPADDGQVNILSRKQQKRRRLNHAAAMVGSFPISLLTRVRHDSWHLSRINALQPFEALD